VLRAPRAGVVAKIAASAGEMVGEGVELVTFEETAEEAPVDGAAQAQPSP
jgi:pyruvate/2-oxoglutarate dehydrogenase complex dihydrolipoamide acyltransferase (E2) component